MRRHKRFSLLLFILPAFAIYTLFQIYPMISGFYYGLTDWDGFSPHPNFIGLDNFKEIVHDKLIFQSVRNSAVFTVLVVLLQNGLSLFFSLLLDQKLKGTALFRTVFFIPILLSTAVVGFVWSTIFSPVIGTWKGLFDFLGLHKLAHLDLLGNSHTALYAVVFVMIWQYLGYSMIIYLAGLQGIPKDLYEACDIDGANRFQKFWNVTFPLIAPSLTINIILSTIGCLKQFDQVFVLTGGGPGDASQVIGTAIYTVAFGNNRYGYGIALSLLLFLAVVLISLVQLRMLKRREVDY